MTKTKPNPGERLIMYLDRLFPDQIGAGNERAYASGPYDIVVVLHGETAEVTMGVTRSGLRQPIGSLHVRDALMTEFIVAMIAEKYARKD